MEKKTRYYSSRMQLSTLNLLEEVGVPKAIAKNKKLIF